MIQRIQTLFLILFIGSIITTFFFPAWQKIEMGDNNEKVKIIVTGSISSTNFIENDKIIIYDHFYISGTLIICCLLALYSIFSYKNRLTQIKIGTINSLFTSLVIFYFLYEVFYNERYIDINDKISFLISFYLIFLAIFFNFLSNRFIRKDELLVSESNRIR
ncbi:MAG: DUF4293 domain-containing protein [Bacteroidota bacterium]|nr:DUF4293 domain-containing protein [Bacteroidota bacterium]